MRLQAPTVSRRVAAALIAPLLHGLAAPPSLAEPGPPEPGPPSLTEPPLQPRITNRATLSILIGTDETPRSVTIGLYGEAAPSSVKLFEGLCTGSLPGQPTLSYRGSTSPRVEPGKQIVLGKLSAGSAQTIERSIDNTGYVRSELVNLADAFTNSDANQLPHDRGGLVSMKQGGGAFEFSITPAANPSLDECEIVIGEVVAGLDVVIAMDAVPVRKPSKDNEVGALVGALGAYDESRYLAVAKAGGDPRARVEQAYRPLQKIRIVDAKLEK